MRMVDVCAQPDRQSSPTELVVKVAAILHQLTTGNNQLHRHASQHKDLSTVSASAHQVLPSFNMDQVVNQVFQEHAIQTSRSEPQVVDVSLAHHTKDHRTVCAPHQNAAQESSWTAMVFASHVITVHLQLQTEEAADTLEDLCCWETVTRLKNLSEKRRPVSSTWKS